MSQILKPPTPVEGYFKGKILVFLAGSIEQGAAPNWQADIERELVKNEKVIVLNPRRDDWDSSWVQSINNPQFKEQVDWELSSQEICDIIFMYFDPQTKSPISLLELGLFARENKLIVCCPDGFWRKGNVEVVCDRYDIPIHNSLEEALKVTKAYIGVTSTGN